MALNKYNTIVALNKYSAKVVLNKYNAKVALNKYSAKVALNKYSAKVALKNRKLLPVFNTIFICNSILLMHNIVYIFAYLQN